MSGLNKLSHQSACMLFTSHKNSIATKLLNTRKKDDEIIFGLVGSVKNEHNLQIKHTIKYANCHHKRLKI